MAPGWSPASRQPASRPVFPGLLGVLNFETARPDILALMRKHVVDFCTYLKNPKTPWKVFEKDPTRYLRDYTRASEFIDKYADAHETSSEEGRLGHFAERITTYLVRGDKYAAIQSLGIGVEECEVEIEERGAKKRVFLPCIDNICVTENFVVLVSNKTSRRGANYKERRDQSRYIPECKKLVQEALQTRGSSKRVVTILGQVNSGTWGKEEELGCDFLLAGRDYAAALTGDPDFFMKVQRLWWTSEIPDLLRDARDVLRSNMWYCMLNNDWTIGDDRATAEVNKDAFLLWRRAYEQPSEAFRKFCVLIAGSHPPG